MKLSILIPSIPEHELKLRGLLIQLDKQKTDEIEILTHVTESENNGGPTTGQKRNDLIDQSRGEYVVFVDADDVIAPDYVESILDAITTDADVITFDVLYRKERTDFRKLVKYSIAFSKDAETPEYFERLPNHLMPIKRHLAHKVKFKNVTFGEDADYARRLKPVIRSEYCIEKVLYYYIDTK